jgi:hypothetical protein
MKIRKTVFVLMLVLGSGSWLLADEGMWLFNAPPTTHIKAKYGYTPSQEWLDHVMHSSVRFNNGGSGSVVSPEGLIITNHHVGTTCLQQLSGAGKDYFKTGYYAKTRADEAKCPDLELNVLQSIEDVTNKVNAGIKPGMAMADVGAAQRAAMANIENDCTKQTSLRCDVVTLYSGGMFHLYKYKKYSDVRLVFAPEFKAAFFGGDPDNFEYPRYDLDIAVFRIYDNDKPIQTTDYLKWSANGSKEGDLIFVSGHPGGTERLDTMSQLGFLRDVQFPWILKAYVQRLRANKHFASQSDENDRIAHEIIFGLENTIKAIKGELAGLQDRSLWGKRESEEKAFRAKIGADAKAKQQAGNAFDEIDQAAKTHREIFLLYTYLERRGGFRGNLAGYARTLLRAPVERQKPNGERLREYRESALASLEQNLFSTAPIYKNHETIVLTESLEEMRDFMGANDPVVTRVLNGKTPAEIAKAVIDGTKLDDVAERKRLYASSEAVAASQDPLIALMRSIDPDARAVRKRYDDEVESVERRDGGALANARFTVYGTNTYPDATFTLRLSYGAVKSYTVNGKHIPAYTTMAGAFQHEAENGGRDPFALPQSWHDHKKDVKQTTPLNFVNTADIIGGNSGSPTLNRNAEFVGIIFDGNIQSLPWDFVYDDTVGRAVSVDSRAIKEALRNIYGAGHLADELSGLSTTTANGAGKKLGKAAPKKPSNKAKP